MIAITQRLVQRREFMLNLGAHALISDVRMLGIGKIKGCRTFRLLLDVPLWCKNIDLVREKIGFQMLEKFTRIASRCLYFEQIH